MASLQRLQVRVTTPSLQRFCTWFGWLMPLSQAQPCTPWNAAPHASW